MENSMTEQQSHLASLKSQLDEFITKHSKATAEVAEYRDTIMKIQGAIDYLNSIGVSLPEEDDNDKEEIKS